MWIKGEQYSFGYQATALIVATVCLADSRPLLAWGTGHKIISEGAYEVLPGELKARWDKTHRDEDTGQEKPIAVSLAYSFCKIPDQADGPSRDGSDIEQRKRATKYLYAELNGEFYPPLAYADPDRDRKKPRPRTYHYFMFPTEELNRAFCLKGARWYFEKISEAFRSGDDLLAAQYAGAFAHAIQDRVSPYHVWDGYKDRREAFEDQFQQEGWQLPENSFRGKAAGASLFWTVGEGGMSAKMEEYQPKVLGKSIEEAAQNFTRELFANRDFAEKVYTNKDGFIRAHLKDDWQNKKSSEETDKYLSEIARENARVTADAWWTAWKLAGGGGE